MKEEKNQPDKIRSKRSKRRKVRWGFLFLLLFMALVIFVLGRAVWRLWEKNVYARESFLETKNKLNDLELRQRFLLEKLSLLQTERGVEEEIRANLPVAKPGEKLVNIVEDRRQIASSTDGESKVDQGAFWRFWRWLTGR